MSFQPKRPGNRDRVNSGLHPLLPRHRTDGARDDGLGKGVP
jgi:hypothetical protein